MSVRNPKSHEQLAPIHPSQGVLTILSESWNLVRLNLKDCLKTMLWPAVLFALSSLAFSIPSSLTFLTSTPIPKMILSVLSLLTGLGIWFGAMVAGSFSYCVLSRLFYSAIVDEKPQSIQACWQHVQSNWRPLILTLFLLLLILAGLIILDFIVLFVGFFISTAVFGGLGISAASIGGSNVLKIAMAVLFLIVWGFVILSLLIVLINGQTLLFTFPFVAIATRPTGQIAWWPSMQQAFRLLWSNFPKLMLFGILFFLFSFLLSTVLHSPIFLWVVLEQARLGIPTQHTIPLYLHIGINLWSVLTSLVLLPFYSSTITLMWYDCQVRKEGLDLKLWLHQLMQRRGFST